jgi:hypothetical protein
MSVSECTGRHQDIIIEALISINFVHYAEGRVYPLRLLTN